MNEEENQEEKRALHKLLREYDSNRGMAGFVCSYPVELMPESEGARLLNGFGTAENLKILEVSREKLKLAKSLDLDESETEKVDRAVLTLGELLRVFTSYRDGSLSIEALRKEVRKILLNPIPESEEGLIDALPHVLEAVDFLATQNIDSKDSWDRSVDCVQMYEALVRLRDVCRAIKAKGSSITETEALANENILLFEGHFKESIDLNETHFQAIRSTLKALWGKE